MSAVHRYAVDHNVLVSFSWGSLTLLCHACVTVQIILMVMVVRDENTIVFGKEMVVYSTRQTPCPYRTYTRERTYVRYARARSFPLILFTTYAFYLSVLYYIPATCVWFEISFSAC